jgi:exonuclease III
MAGEIFQWNINGLKCKQSPNYKGKCETLKSILDKNDCPFILNIQETHFLNESDLPKLLKPYNHLYHFEKTFAKNDDPAAGILICIRKTEEVLSSEVVESGRLMHIKIKNTANNEIHDIFSIYCKSNNPEKQKQLITKLKRKIVLDQLTKENCIILGDFNFVTSILDRNSQTLNRVDIETNKTWGPFENEYNLQDCYRLTNPARRQYSYTSKINQKSRSRIDRVYVSTNLCGRIISSTFINTLVSDHKIYKIKLATQIKKGPGLWIFNNTLLSDNTFTTPARELINSFTDEMSTLQVDKRYKWDIFQQKISSFTKEFSKEKSARNNKEFNQSIRELENLEKLHPQKLLPATIERIESLKQKINDHHKKRLQGASLRSKLPKFEQNEPGIAFLSALEKRKGEENTIFSIFDDVTKTIKTDTEGIKDSIYNFYSSLYKKEEEDTALQTQFLEKVDLKLEINERDALDLPLSENELYEALKSLQDNKSPGTSGLTKEFYVYFWEDLK